MSAKEVRVGDHVAFIGDLDALLRGIPERDELAEMFGRSNRFRVIELHEREGRCVVEFEYRLSHDTCGFFYVEETDVETLAE